ncbi:MAG: hypothetical protein WCN88_05400 [Candidatus Falkowbacteria bacterium]
MLNQENIPELVERLETELPHPFISVQVSTLGGVENASIMLLIGFEDKTEWAHGYVENSIYARVMIDTAGRVEHFSGNKTKLRSFVAKGFDEIIDKLTNKLVIK